VYRSSGETSTWGAYQCYGDPRLFAGCTPASTSRIDARIVAGAELRGLVDVIALRAKTADSATTKHLLEELQALASSSAQGWMESSATCAALGSAFAELGMFEEALSYYHKSRALYPSNAKVESLEHLADLSGRLAVEYFSDMLGTRAGDAPRHGAHAGQTTLRGSRADLDALLVIGRTSERLSLKGSLCKRRAMVAGIQKAPPLFAADGSLLQRGV
jgi:hypothetical protein